MSFKKVHIVASMNVQFLEFLFGLLLIFLLYIHIADPFYEKINSCFEAHALVIYAMHSVKSQ